jgi:endogenous inhibitor of DNA gyrase (YacG/DUF329 family)
MAAMLRCPICKKPVAFEDPNMPFCSDRCRAIDLGNWATEKYAVPTLASPDEPEELHEAEQDEGSTN